MAGYVYWQNIHIGMAADLVLQLPGRDRSHASNPPTETVGNEEGHGLIVRWNYPDVVLEMRHRDGEYRVCGIYPRKGEDNG